MLDFFDNVYCINLNTRADRWNSCLAQFDKYKIKAERFPAVVYENKNYDRKTNGACGCWLSHYSILKKFVNSDFEKILILEDDFNINFAPDYFDAYMSETLKELPSSWDIFYLSVYFNDNYGLKAKEDYSKNLFKVNFGLTTHAMAYSRDGAEKLLSQMNLDDEEYFEELVSEYSAIDWFLAKKFQKENNCYSCKDFVCGQLSGFSDIEKKFVSIQPFFVENYEILGKISV